MNDSVRRNLSTSSPVWPPQREKSIPSVGSWAKKRLRNRPGKLIPTNSAACCVAAERAGQKSTHTHTLANECWCLKSFVFVAALYLPQSERAENGFGNRGERKKLDQPQLAAGDRSGLVLQTIAACTLFLFLFAERRHFSIPSGAALDVC